MSIPEGFVTVVNFRSRRIIHLVRAQIPQHLDETLCGLSLKGRRWHTVSSQAANCNDCLGRLK